MSASPLIEVRSISKYFGSVIALKDISMICYPGEVMCLLDITSFHDHKDTDKWEAVWEEVS